MKTRQSRCEVLLVLLSLSSWVTACGQSPTEQVAGLGERLQEIVNRGAQLHNAVGFAAGVFVPGQGTWLVASGISHGTTPLTPGMGFHVASITKALTATVVCQLIEEGAVALEDSLHNWLPSYPNIDSTITVHQLLHHTSGVRDIWNHPSIWDSVAANWSRVWTAEEVLSTFVGEPHFPPGTGWYYTNTNYILLGLIIESATGSSLAEELRQRIMDPLGLEHTYLAAVEPAVGTLAHGWIDVDDDGILDDISAVENRSYYSIGTASSALVTSAGDLITFSQALLGGQLLGQEMLDQMLTDRVATPVPDRMRWYGYGIQGHGPTVVGDVEAWGHTGGTGGYLATWAYLPDWDAHIVIFQTGDADVAQVYGKLKEIISATVEYLSVG